MSRASGARAHVLARNTSPWERLRASSGSALGKGQELGATAAPRDLTIHNDAAAGEVAKAWGARAFTLGRDVYFATGALQPKTDVGRRLIAHEFAHASNAVAPKDGAPFAAHDSLGERQARGVADGDARGYPTSGSQPAVFRHTVNSVPAAHRARLAVLGDGTPANPGMTIQDFESYVSQQADWFVEPSLTAADRDALWRMVLLLQEPGVGAGLGDLRLPALTALPPADLPALRAYAAGADAGAQTVRITARHSNIARVLQLGRALIELATFVPDAVLRVCITQAQLETLVDEGLIATFRTYYTDFQPTIENPAEIQYLLELLREGLGVYAPLRGFIHDLHVFTRNTRVRLVTNMGDTSGGRPVLLILMSGLDWNSAFIQGANVEAAVINPFNLGLVIQGPTSLAAAGGLVTTIADRYGQIPPLGGPRRLGQVVIAGHGLDTSVELGTAGLNPTPEGEDDNVGYDEEPLDAAGQNTNPVPANVTAAQGLIDTILQRMDPDDARVVFAGCLVGSHSVDPATHVADPATAAANIRAAIATNPNLADFVRSRMSALGVTGEVNAANASTSFDAFRVETFGRAGLGLDWDPDIGGSKAAYVTTGSEPEGALRAALETWADPLLGPAWTTATMRQRVTNLTGIVEWYETLTRTAFELALPAPPADVSAAALLDLSHRVGSWMLAGWADMADADAMTVSIHTPVEAAAVYGAMLTSEFAGSPHLPIIVQQAWMDIEPAHEAAFLAALDVTTLTRLQLQTLLGNVVINRHLNTLLAVGGAPSVGQMRLALTIAVRDGTSMPPQVVSFLRAAAGGAPTASFPAALGVPALLGGASEFQVLRDIGLAPGSSGGAAIDDANADLDANGMNERFIELRPREAIVDAFALNVRSRPRMGDNVIGWLHRGDTVRVMGESHGWSAIDFNGRMAFVYHRFIRP